MHVGSIWGLSKTESRTNTCVWQVCGTLLGYGRRVQHVSAVMLRLGGISTHLWLEPS